MFFLSQPSCVFLNHYFNKFAFHVTITQSLITPQIIHTSRGVGVGGVADWGRGGGWGGGHKKDGKQLLLNSNLSVMFSCMLPLRSMYSVTHSVCFMAF